MIFSGQLPEIGTPRLRLRWLSETDVPALFEVFSDPEVVRYFGSPRLRDIADAAQFLEESHTLFDQKILCKWGVARFEDDRVIGTCTLSNIDDANRRAEIGFALGRNNWGRGYMTEALQALIAFAFEIMNLHRLEADVDPRNAAAIRTIQRLGFREEGRLRERWFVNNEIQDSVFFGLLRNEWRESSFGRDCRTSANNGM